MVFWLKVWELAPKRISQNGTKMSFLQHTELSQRDINEVPLCGHVSYQELPRNWISGHQAINVNFQKHGFQETKHGLT